MWSRRLSVQVVHQILTKRPANGGMYIHMCHAVVPRIPLTRLIWYSSLGYRPRARVLKALVAKTGHSVTRPLWYEYTLRWMADLGVCTKPGTGFAARIVRECGFRLTLACGVCHDRYDTDYGQMH